MLKFTIFIFLVFSICLVKSDTASCNSRNINISTPIGALPYDASDVVPIPHGTHCLYKFSVPYGYALQLQTVYNLVDSGSAIFVTNSLGETMMYNGFGGTVQENYWCTAGSCQVEVQSVSGLSFITNYWFKPLRLHTAIDKLTGDYFQLSDIRPNRYVKYYGSRVAMTLEQNTSQESMPFLKNYYVYNGSDIIQSALIGTLAGLKKNSLYFGYNFVCIVNFYTGYDSSAFVIANDATAISNSYKFVLTSPNKMTSQEFSDYSEDGTSVTFACSDCNQFYVTQLVFENTSSTGYIALQGQSPSHIYLPKVIYYNASTFTEKELPQTVPTNKITIYIYKCNFTIQLYSGNDYQYWQTPYFGRKGVITSATVWDNLLETGNFTYEFRDNAQLFNFNINMSNMNFGGGPTDQVTLMIGTGPGYNNLVNLTYPVASNTSVSSVGNYMYISSNFSMFTKFILPFAINEGLTTIPMTSTKTVPVPSTRFITTTTKATVTSTTSPTTQSTSTAMPTTAINTTQNSSPSYSTSTVGTTTSSANSEFISLLVFVITVVNVYF